MILIIFLISITILILCNLYNNRERKMIEKMDIHEFDRYVRNGRKRVPDDKNVTSPKLLKRMSKYK